MCSVPLWYVQYSAIHRGQPNTDDDISGLCVTLRDGDSDGWREPGMTHSSVTPVVARGSRVRGLPGPHRKEKEKETIVENLLMNIY